MKWMIGVGIALLLVLLCVFALLDSPSTQSAQPQQQPHSAPPATGSSDEQALKNLKIN